MRVILSAVLFALTGVAQNPPPAKPVAKAEQPPAADKAQDKEKIPELRELRVRFRHLVARAIAVKSVLKSVEDNLAHRGYTLNIELLAARTRVEEFLDDAEQDLKDGKRADLLDDLDHAEASIMRLERMIGQR
jgi:hypothetical protein